jgi:Arylsulfotransferase (ASST)
VSNGRYSRSSQAHARSHINSVDKNADGDYLVSARYTSTVYKIAGLASPSGLQPGEIIWRLGGKRSSFDLTTQVAEQGAFNFSFQHHARFHVDGTITFWDNAMSVQGTASALASAAKQVAIDETAKTATLIWQGAAPSRFLDEARGSHQLLANGNHFCGVGSSPEIFERTPEGKAVFGASFGAPSTYSYRAFREPWIGRPSMAELALFSFARTCAGPTTFYASWNGATEVAQYRIQVANSTRGVFTACTIAATGDAFETIANCPNFALYSYAEALGADGTTLGRTPTVRTFVPAEQWAAQCAEDRCADEVRYESAARAVCVIEDKYVG